MSVLFILIPLVMMIMINLPPKRFGLRPLFWSLSAFLLAQILSILILRIDFWNQPLGGKFSQALNLEISLDPLGLVFLICIAISAYVSVYLTDHIIREEDRRFNFLNLILAAVIGMNGLVLVNDIFSLYVFIEVASIATFILIAHTRKRDAFEGAFKYIALSIVATALMLSAIALIFLVTGNTGFGALKQGLASAQHNRLVLLALGIFLGGVFIKAGAVPFHGWLVDAYTSSGICASVLLAGIVTKAVGIYTLIRVTLSVFGFSAGLSMIFLIIGSVSIVIAALVALVQEDFKRMLAYSSISQVGYIILGLGCGNILGFAGAILHIFNHTVFKSLLFVNSGALEHQLSTRDMNRVSGLAKKMPLTAGSSLLAALSASGIPPLAGFWSKLLIIVGLWQGHFYIFAIIALLASLLTLAYLLAMERKIFFGPLSEGLENLREAPLGILLPTIFLSLILIASSLGVFFLINKFILPAAGGLFSQ